jgi:hypothetical protein
MYGAQSIANRDSFWSHEYVVLVHVRPIYFIRSVSATMTMANLNTLRQFKGRRAESHVLLPHHSAYSHFSLDASG